MHPKPFETGRLTIMIFKCNRKKRIILYSGLIPTLLRVMNTLSAIFNCRTGFRVKNTLVKIVILDLLLNLRLRFLYL